VTFELRRLRFHFRATQPIVWPHAGNALRGALGAVLHREPDAYGRIFRPHAAGAGPSGLADQPRPFVIRAAHLDGAALPPGAHFHFDVYLFERSEAMRNEFQQAYATLARAALLSVEEEDIAVDLAPAPEPVACVRVRFVTPTELKAGAELVKRPEFGILIARLRDRIGTLRALYGAGPLDLDFREFGERAARVRMTRCELQWTTAERRSRGTGQTHPLGGFTGVAEYEGDLGEFLPYLRAGQYTGVGRQTVWGKGEIRVTLDTEP